MDATIDLPPGFYLNPRTREEVSTLEVIKVAGGNDRHQRGNTTTYEEAVKRVFVVGHIWGHSGTEYPNTDVETDLVCLQASRAAVGGGGGNNPNNGDTPDGGSGGNGGGGGGSQNAGTRLSSGESLLIASTLLAAVSLVI